MFSFFKNSVFGVISVASRLASSFFLNKMVALYFGPAGIVQLAHFQNLVTFFTLVPNDGISRGLIKYLAGNDTQSLTFRTYFRSGFYLTLTVFFAITLLLVSARSFFLPYFPSGATWLILFLIGVFLLVLQSFLNAVLLARQKNGWLLVVNTLAALGVLGYVALATGKIPLPYFLNGYLLLLGCIGLITVPFSLKGLPKIPLFQPRISKAAWQQLSKFILMAGTVMLFSKGLEYYIRDYSIQHFTIQQTGLWQGVVRISDSYTAVYTAVLAFAFYPKVAALLQQEPELKLFVRQALKLLAPVVAAGLCLVYFTRDYLFTWLLSAQFKAAEAFLPFQLTGDFCKLISWLLANILVAQAKFKITLLFEAISAFFYLGFFYFFTHLYGIQGNPMAHCAHYLIFLLLNLVYFRKLLLA
ncbi:hypothetical protein AHMF7605_07450 [Adhaeribacter arboris]|uniref:O-antigen translocase n=1 Tax=Adhaeribacter arboris TaxID=2072846 RepID=A0A2T2YCZ8_9BACT|nr:hypothetical protein [Adhaeribacter arboris]PSR53373.1 hypothetical protein AHMF7605_07450 [Adhaeribacter arboris]